MKDYATISSDARSQKGETDTKSASNSFKEQTLFDGILLNSRPIYKTSKRLTSSASTMETGRHSNIQNNLLSQLGSFNLLKKAATKINSSIRRRAKQKNLPPRLITDEQLHKLQITILSGRFNFKGFYAKEIRKKDKKTFRGLSIPSSKLDRVVYKALLYVLFPIFENYISSSVSYGVVKKKGLHVAIKDLVEHINQGYEFVLTADIKSFFNEIPKWLLRQVILPKLPDNSINKLVGEALIFEYRNSPNDWELFPDYNIGIAQGTALSPLFADIFLKSFDKVMKKNGFVVLRYVDDFVLLGKTRKELYKGYLKARSILKTLRLNLHEYNHKKCKASHISEFPTFLGIDVGPNGYLRPNKHKLHTFKQKLDGLIERLPQTKLEENLESLNSAIEGWSGAYKICNRIELEKYYSELNELILKGLNRLSAQKRINLSKHEYLLKNVKKFKYPIEKNRKSKARHRKKISRPSYGSKPSSGQLRTY